MSDNEIVVADERPRAVTQLTEWSYETEIPSLQDSLSKPKRTGYVIMTVFVLGFGVWAELAPLSGAAVAPGVISPTSSRKTVAHLEGGIVRELKVREGEMVTAGQPLVELDPLQSSSNYDVLLNQRLGLEARQARLEAERNKAETITFPAELMKDGKPTAAAQSQVQMFESRRTARLARTDVLSKRVAQLSEQAAGTRAQAESTLVQQKLINEELAAKNALVDKGLMPRPELLRLQRDNAALSGTHAQYVSELGRLDQQLAEAKLQMQTADAEYFDDVVAQSDKVQSDLAEVAERARASEDVLKRTMITAPVSGTVINMRAKTVGGIVSRGEAILEIVPSEDALLIDAHVYPNDIHRVHPGQVADIHLAGYSQRILPRLHGVVRSVSPDRVTDPSNGQQHYYLARVEVDRDQLKKEAPNVQLIAGMQADVVIIAEERTVLDYLLQPLKSAFRRGMRES
jgi:HlyD family secretion protein